MKPNSNHRLHAAAILIAAAFLSAAPAGAQECLGLIPGSHVVPEAPVAQLYAEGPGAVGDNLMGIPAFSPINDVRTGFPQICRLFGLEGTQSEITQINAQTGNIISFHCDHLVAPDFQPCQAVLVRLAPGVGPATAAMPMGTDPEGREIHADGSWVYPTFGLATSRFINGHLGEHLFGVPLTMEDVDGDGNNTGEDICLGLNLVIESEVLSIDAGEGRVYTHRCGQVPTFRLSGGEGVRIRSGATCPSGAPCAVGSIPS